MPRTSASFPGCAGGSSPCCWRGPGWSRGVPPPTLGAPAQLHVGPAHCPSSRLLSSPAWRLRRPPTLPLRPRLGPKQPLHPAVLPAKREGKSRMMPSGPSRSDKVTCVLGEGEGRGWPSAGVAGGHWGPGSSPPFPGPEWVHSAQATRSPREAGWGATLSTPTQASGLSWGYAGLPPSPGPGVRRVPAVAPCGEGRQAAHVLGGSPCPGSCHQGLGRDISGRRPSGRSGRRREARGRRQA